MNHPSKKVLFLTIATLLTGCIPKPSPSLSPIQTEESSEVIQTPSPIPTVNDDMAIRLALAAYLGTGVNDVNITVSQNTGSHARGGVDNGYFLAAKVNDQWLIVADGQAMPDCQVVAQYGFPAGMVPECSDKSGILSDEDLIRTALATHLGVNAQNLTITISRNTGSHARGGVDNGYFLVAKVNDQWQIVADGQAMPDCQVVAQYGFPASMVPECTSPNEIKFKPGGTFTTIQKMIKAGEEQTYSVNAIAGQTMILGVSSENNDVYIAVKGAGSGQQLVSNSSHSTSWTGTFPQTQPYLVSVTTDNPDTYYFLTIEIPVIVQFETGTDSATIFGYIEIFEDSPTVSVDNHVTYLVYATAGQTMDVKLLSPNIDDLSLGIYGQDDGQPYLRYEVKNSGFHGVLPTTQGYYLKVFSNKKSTDFTLEITIAF